VIILCNVQKWNNWVMPTKLLIVRHLLNIHEISLYA